MKILRIISSFFLFVHLLSIAQTKTIQLIPPNLDDASIVIKGACDRPRRKEGVNISIENKNDKTILHCYGHGGFGFTTLFGSIQEALDLFLKQDLTPSNSIRIIGSGCMGLTLAIELYRLGFTNISISTKEKYNIPSWRAGGFFDPGTGSESSSQEKYHLNLGIKTYKTLLEIEQDNHPYLSSKVARRLPIYYPAEIECGVEILEKMGFVPRSEIVTIDFGNGVKYGNFKKQDTYFIDISLLMNELWHHIKTLNIPVVYEEVTSFDSCKESVICNCTGVGSKKLNNDTSIQPARGHFFMLKAYGQSLDYLLFTKVLQKDKLEYIYFFPKQSFFNESGEYACTGLMGGTFIPCDHLQVNELQELDQKEFEKLANRTRDFFYKNQKTTIESTN